MRIIDKKREIELYQFISISGKWFPKDLKENFNITPQKTLTLKFPDKMPNKFIPHFIRGYFDGDGSISKSTGSKLQMNIIGTEDILNYFREYFYNIGIRLKSKNRVTPLISKENNITKVIHYSGKNAIKILDNLYKSSENIRLDRKYNKYIKLKG